MNHDIFESGVFGDGPTLFAPELSFFTVFDLTFLARFLTLSAACLALAGVFFAAAFALLAVALALAGAFFAADLALFATALLAEAALSALFAAAAIFFATAAFIPALTSFAAPAPATLDTVSNLASTNFAAVAAPTPGG